MKIKIELSNDFETEFARIVYALLRGYFRGRTVTGCQNASEITLEVL